MNNRDDAEIHAACQVIRRRNEGLEQLAQATWDA
jgi:hypothetical protein